MEAPNTSETNRATLLDLTRGGTGVIEVQRQKLDFGEGALVEPDADYNGPILVPPAENAKFEAALARWYKSQGQEYTGNHIDLHYGHATHEEAVEDARKEYAAGPCLVRHEDGLYYMHNEDKPGRPTIIDVELAEILQ